MELSKRLKRIAEHVDKCESVADIGTCLLYTSLGICGEHGGDPSSVEFCHNLGLNYVSCSPYRVPLARLAAAQAQVKNKR